jgi:hypothetical protein
MRQSSLCHLSSNAETSFFGFPLVTIPSYAMERKRPNSTAEPPIIDTKFIMSITLLISPIPL